MFSVIQLLSRRVEPTNTIYLGTDSGASDIPQGSPIPAEAYWEGWHDNDWYDWNSWDDSGNWEEEDENQWEDEAYYDDYRDDGEPEADRHREN